MRLVIRSPEELGLVLRAVRKDSRVPLEDLALTVGVSRQTATNVELGQAKLSTMFDFLREMGIELSVDIPSSAHDRLERVTRQAAARATRRRPRA